MEIFEGREASATVFRCSRVMRGKDLLLLLAVPKRSWMEFAQRTQPRLD